jgi:membrane protease YdiL (CAAX protease family)
MRKIRVDWHLEAGVAGPVNLCVLVLVLFSFPVVLRGTGALAVANIDALSAEHTPAFVRFCFVITAFLWVAFAVALAGIRIRGKGRVQDLIGIHWYRWQAVIRDISISLLVLLVIAVIGNLSNKLLGSWQQDTATYRSMVAQNSTEALAFLTLALTAGFAEEFVFRGYMQRQFQALCGNTLLASVLQVLVFTQGHFYQGWTRLVPVVLIGAVLTAVALCRKSLVPGMLAHGFGDGLVAFSFFARHF